MNRPPLLAGTAALAVVALVAASGSAAGSTTPAAGSASSTVTALHVTAGGHDLRAVDLVLRSDTTTSPRVSRIEITPVTADGTAYGRQVVDQGNSPQGIGSVSSPTTLAPYARLVSPGLDASATSLPSNKIGAASLGSLSLLGIPVGIAGALQTATSVSSTSGALATKTVTLKNLSLPSVADLLAALGLDLSKLPISTLTSLLSQLQLVTTTVNTAQAAVDTAQASVDAAVADLAAKTATLTSAQGVLTTAQATLTTATAALQTLLNNPVVQTITGSTLTVAQFEALVAASSPLVATLEAAISGLSAAQTDYVNAQTAVTAATAAVAAAQTAVNTAQALLTSLQSALQSAISTLLGAVTSVLDGTPLVSLAKLEVSTKALVTSAKAGGQTAEVVGGTITGLKVLGTDVLATALGTTTVDVGALVGTAATKVTTTINGLTSTLSSVLSSVPGFPTLDLPAPKVGLLTKSTSTSISDGFGRAATSVTGLSITLPGITLPTSLALPGASALPAFDSVTQVAGTLVSAPVSLSLLTLREQAAFRPAVVSGSSSTSTPGTSGGLPPTGLPVGAALLALALVGTGLVLRRRFLPQG